MSGTEVPAGLRPQVDASNDRVVAIFGGRHYVFQNNNSVLHFQYTTDGNGVKSDRKPVKNVLAHLSNIGFSVRGFESYYE